MKIYINIKGVILSLLLLVLFGGCSDFLDEESKENLTDQTQWETEQNSDIYLNSLYGDLPNMNRTAESMDFFTDDYNISHYYTASNWRQGICIAPSSSTTGIWGGTQGPTESYSWNNFFKKLRKCNTYLVKMEENKANFSDEFYNKRKDEVRFLRAYFYSKMLQLYGGVPLVLTPLDRNSMTEDELCVGRCTFEDTYNFIASELQSIVEDNYLDDKYNSGNPDAGRATIGAALALKGCIDLYVASPLFNTNDPYLDDPGYYVHFKQYDAARWTTAAQTNKAFIDRYDKNTYDLFSSLPDLWRTTNEYNCEIIWDRQCVVNTSQSSNYERFGGVTYVLGAYYSWGNYNPTQELVDDFLMANGKEITDPTSGYDPQKPFTGREKRFYDFIVYDGCEYKMDWMPQSEIIYTRIDKINPSQNEIDLAGKTDTGDSGYYQKKRINQEAAPGPNASGQNLVFIRYAEIFLNYAEAQNEVSGPDASIYAAINRIRVRSTLPELNTGLTKDEMREEIQKERRRELCFEGKRYFDTQRLKKLEDRMGVARHNMVIKNSKPEDNSGVWVYSVEPEVKYSVKVEPKQYMTPIPQDVIDQNPKIIQNPGY